MKYTRSVEKGDFFSRNNKFSGVTVNFQLQKNYLYTIIFSTFNRNFHIPQMARAKKKSQHKLLIYYQCTGDTYE
jgi:hypothetical protein